MFGNAFKSRPNYVFDYKPRYYNERKERLENLQKKYENNTSNDINSGGTIIKDSLKNDWKRSKHFAHDKSYNTRLALIIVVLVGIASYILELHTLF